MASSKLSTDFLVEGLEDASVTGFDLLRSDRIDEQATPQW
jgi:hypothetical protein